MPLLQYPAERISSIPMTMPDTGSGKVVDGAVTQMCYAGDLLVSERTGSEKTLWYRYDSSGNVLIALTYESEIYMYL